MIRESMVLRVFATLCAIGTPLSLYGAEVAVELSLPTATGAGNEADMRAGIDWLLANGFAVDRCGIVVSERRLSATAMKDDALVEATNAGFTLIPDALAGPRGGVDPNYFDPTDIETFLVQVVADHPSIARKFVVGTTTDGRSIFGLEISDHPGIDEDEPSILLNGLHHAREVVTPHIVTDAIDTLTDGYAANDPQIVGWVQNYKSIMVPMVNPDGSARVFAGDTSHRKNTRAVCTGGNLGVDLNRNYPYRWGGGTVCNAGVGSSGSTCSDAYRGPSAGSEPETTSMMALSEIMGFSVVVSYHSSGRFIDYPYACNDGSPDERMPEHDVIDEMMHGMAGAIFGVDGIEYDVNSPVAIGPVNGDDTSWYYAHQGAYPFIVETATSFQPPFADVAGIVARNRAAWMYLYERIGQARIDVHVTAACVPVEAEVSILDYAFDTDELPRIARLPFGRWTFLVPANDFYVLRITKDGFQTTVVPVAVGISPVDMQVELVPLVASDLLMGDLNDDCVVNGRDVSPFVQTLLLGDAAPANMRLHGDFDGDCIVAMSDIAPFTVALLTGPVCP